jgi:hypothetical protein
MDTPRILRSSPRKSLSLLVATGMVAIGLVLAGPVRSTYAAPLNDCVRHENGDPILTALTAPDVVDVTQGAQSVHFTITAVDRGGPGPASGLKAVWVAFGQSGFDEPGAEIHRLVEQADGTWAGDVLVQQGSRGGVSPIVAVDLKDNAGNHRTIWRSGLKAAGLPSGIEVISTPDRTRPRLTSFTVEPVSVDTRTHTQMVTFTATAADDLSGIGSVDFFGSMGGRSITNAVDGDFVTLDPVEDTPNTLSGTIEVDRWVGSGTWRVKRLFVEDKVGNLAFYSSARLDELGFAHTLDVRSRTDTSRPEIVEFTADPTAVDVQSADGDVTFTVRARDEGAGVTEVFAFVGWATGWVRLDRAYGTSHNGVWTGTVTVSRCQASTRNHRINIDVGDGNRHHRGYTSTDLAANGWPSRLSVTAADHTRPHARMPWRGGPDDHITVRFNEPVNGITSESATMRRVRGGQSDSYGPVRDGTWSCQDGDGAATSCESGSVRRATFAMEHPFVASRNYVLTLNPEFCLSATDLAGNPFIRDQEWIHITA